MKTEKTDNRKRDHGKKHLMIMAIFVCTLSSINFAANDSTADQKLEVSNLSLSDLFNLKVSGVSKIEENIKFVPMSVYVVTKDEAQQMGIHDLYDIFQRVPGYSFYNTDYYGQYGAIGRGLQSVWRYGFSYELMNLVDFGHVSFSPNFFKTIEIARGPAGLMWGSGAEAGLINFNLRDDVRGLESYTDFGTYGRFGQDVLWGGAFGKEGNGDGFFVGYHFQKQDPEVIDNAFDPSLNMASTKDKINGYKPTQQFVAKLKYDNFKFLFYQDHSRHIAPLLWYGGANVQDYLEETLGSDWGDEMELMAYRLEYTMPFDDWFGKKKLPFSVMFYHDFYHKQWQTESIASDQQRKMAFGGKIHASLLKNNLTIDFGGDFYGQDLNTAPSFTTHFADSAFDIGWYDNAIHPSSKVYQNCYLQGSYKFFENYMVLLGGRFDYDTTAGLKPRSMWSGPRIGLFGEPIQNFVIKLLYNSAARSPQANESNSGLSGVPETKPERLGAFESVFMYTPSDLLSIDLTFFYQKLNDEIVRLNNYAGQLNVFTNVPGLENKGVEWAIKSLPTKNLQLFWNGSCNYAQVQEKKINDSLTVKDASDYNNYPLFVPMLTTYWGFDYSFLNIFRITPSGRYIYKIPYQTIDGSYSSANAFFVDLSLRSSKFFKDRFEVFASVLNILNNQDPLPAYGEHLSNVKGTVKPEGRRIDCGLYVHF